MTRPGPAPGHPSDTSRPPESGLPLAHLIGEVRPPLEVVRAFVAGGRWSTQSVLHDLYRGAAAHPHRTAIVAHRAKEPAETRVIRLSYSQLATYTERFAHALDALGVRPGDLVAFQLPNRWESCALLLACLRTGAVAVPIMEGYGARDLSAVLTVAQPRLCAVPERWQACAPAQALAVLAPALPWLRHRAVLGDAAATGAIDFVGHFVHTPHERYRHGGCLPLPVGLADRICLAVTSLGLHASHSMAWHTPNSLYAGIDPGAEGATFSALPLASLPTLVHAVIGPLTRGGTVVLQDVWDPEAALELMAEADVCQAYATPAQWAEIAAEQEQRPRSVGALRQAVAFGTVSASTGLVRKVQDSLRVPLLIAARPAPAGETGTASGDRGPASPLVVWRRESGRLRLTWEKGQAASGDFTDLDEEVGGLFLIPVTEVEERLLTHHRVAEAAVVACSDPEHGELACAVVVPAGDTPTLSQLRDHLLAQGISPAHLPARLELLGALPRTALGELRRRHLQETLGC